MSHRDAQFFIDTDAVLQNKLCAFLAVDKYLELLGAITPDQIRSREFQKRFNHFCMVRRNEAWQTVFYGLFAELAEKRGGVTLRDVLPELDGRLKSKLGEERLEISFSSKMLAFLRPNDYPIWDSWVVKNMLDHYGVDLRLKVVNGIKEREQEALMRFDELTAWFRKAVATKSIKQALKLIVNILLVTPLFAQWNGNATYYNANGSFGGSSRTTTLGNQTTTYHHVANGASAGRSVTTQFGTQTTTTHYDQYGRPAGTTRNNVVGR